MKENNWCRFLAVRGPENALKAYFLTKEQSPTTINPLQRSTGDTIAKMGKIAEILFHGTSEIKNVSEMGKINLNESYLQGEPFFPITRLEGVKGMDHILKQISDSSDDIPNEILKRAKTQLTSHLDQIIKIFVKKCYFSQQW
ncbi:hypothetical protein O181_022399 [Austropuccinia psidii MF-1]|uniref:Uncharacterized protein n=1 Tax=Austropuccinia psidii MF-1 TaxID=1389203 RepID=A0A9Q3CCI8_9BASI|nr:hypothetical protein [Austropuccinia psidii MF-1]